MKLNTIVNENIATNCEDEVDFALDNASTGQIIGIVTSLYTNPELAFVRETCSNAYDAHTIAGKEDVPFDFHLPTRLEPYIRIRDYGTGLSEDFMRNKYTKAGLSTKRDDNGQIGGFGVGRLSFLNVADQAAITSYYNGKKIITAINKGEYGNLKMQVQFVGETDEPNGLELQFPVEPNRINAFSNAVQTYFSRIERVHPKWLGQSPNVTMVEYSTRDDKFGARNNGGSGIRAVMGGVAYEFSADAVRGDDDFDKVKALIGTDIDLFFNIGEVIPTPSREALDMNPKTRKALLSRLIYVRKTIVDGLKEKLSECKFLYQAIAVYQETIRPLSWDMTSFVNSLDLDFNGEKLRNNRTIQINSPTIKKTLDKKELNISVVNFHSRIKKNYGGTFWRTQPTSYISLEAKNFENAVFVLNDVVRGMRPTIDYNYDRESDVFLVNELVDGKGFKKAKSMLKKMGVHKDNIVLASELDEIPKEERTTTLRSTTSFRQFTSNVISENTRGCSSVEMSELEEGTVYVQAFNSEIIPENMVFANRYNFLRKYDVIPKVQVVVINKTQYRYIDSNWISLEDYIYQFEQELQDFTKKAKNYAVLSYKSNILRKNTHDMLSPKRGYWDKERQDKTLAVNYQGNLAKMLDVKFGADRKDLNDLIFILEKVLCKQKAAQDKFADLPNTDSVVQFCKTVGIDFKDVMSQGTPTCRAFTRMTNLRKSYLFKIVSEAGNINPKLLLKTIKETNND